MEKMFESEFDKIIPSCKEENCSHNNIVKLILNGVGAHSDYGCKDCKAVRFNLKDF